MDNIAIAIQSYIEKLRPIYGAGEARSLAHIAIEECLQMSRTQVLLADKDSVIEPKKRLELEAILEKLIARVPLQYILGKCSFYGMELKISPAALIPRPETEELIAFVIERFASQEGIKALDVGTGSGCIAVALARHLPQSTITAIDISEAALELAQSNASDLPNCRFVRADMHDANLQSLVGTGYKLILSNPPYIMTKEAETMDPEVLQQEPHTALFASEGDPLHCYRSLAEIASSEILVSGGSIYAELNPLLAEETLALWQSYPALSQVALIQDCSKKLRFIQAEKRKL